MLELKHRILLVDDHALLRAALRALLMEDPGFEIVGEAENGNDAILLVGKLAPHQIETTVRRDVLDAWSKTKGIAVAVPVVANLAFAQISNAEKQGMTTAWRKSQHNGIRLRIGKA